jgi:hypothetical protein
MSQGRRPTRQHTPSACAKADFGNSAFTIPASAVTDHPLMQLA